MLLHLSISPMLIGLILLVLVWCLFGAVRGAFVVSRLIDRRIYDAPLMTLFWMHVIGSFPALIAMVCRRSATWLLERRS